MPPIDAPHLIEYLYEVGPTMPGGGGEAPLTFQELQFWQDGSGIALHPWQRALLRRLSVEYLNEQARAAKRDCPAPWMPERYDAHRKGAAARALRDSLRAQAA